MKKYIKTIIIGLSVATFFSCSHDEKGHGDHAEGGHGHESILDKVKKQDVTAKYEFTSVDYLVGEKLVKVDSGFTGKDFLISERESQITHFNCSSCHTEDLAELQGKDAPKSHWQIKLEHAGPKSMNCQTCHGDPKSDSLTSITGEHISFNQSYQTCAQCHSTQYKDWLGGAHGKRKGGWANPRVSNTCVNCHNPHSPSFKSRWPSRYNKTMAKMRRDNKKEQ